MASDGLRERLIAAKLVGTNAPTQIEAWDYRLRSNEGAATVALEVVTAWLHDEAARLRRAEPNATGSIRDHLVAGADRLEILARSLDGEPTTNPEEGA